MATTYPPDTDNLEALVIADLASGRVALWNLAAESLFGYSVEEAVGLPIAALLPEQQPLLDATRAVLEAAAAHVSAGAERQLVVQSRDRRGAALDIALSLGVVDAETDAGRFLFARAHRLDRDGATPRAAEPPAV